MSNTIPLSLDNRIFYNTKNVFGDFHLYFAMICKAACKECTMDGRKIGFQRLRQYANKILDHSHRGIIETVGMQSWIHGPASLVAVEQ